MNIIGSVGLLLGVALLIVGAFKGFAVLPLTVAASFIIVVFNGLPVWESFSVTYITGFASGIHSYFLIFMFSCLYSKLMEDSGSALSIAYLILRIVGKKNVMTACCIIATALAYGGVSVFIIGILCAPIMFTLFHEADIPRPLAICPIVFAAGSLVGFAPGSTQMVNIVPTEFLGTNLMTGWPIAIAQCVFLIIVQLIYVNREVKKAKEKQEHFEFPEGTDASKFTLADESALIPVWRALAPIIVLLGGIIVCSPFVDNASMLTVGFLVIGCLLIIVLNFRELKAADIKNTINLGFASSFGAVSSIAALLGFGAVLQNTRAYSSLIDSLVSLDMNPYLKLSIVGGVLSAIVGSASGGSRLTYNSLIDYINASNLNSMLVHRTIQAATAFTASTPHCAGLFVHFGAIKCNHKQCYKHSLVIAVIIPFFCWFFLLLGILIFVK